MLIDFGYWGMLLSSFLAGSVFPFSSEAIMLGLLAAGLNPVYLIIYATIGNVAGSMFNYGVGRMGKMEWIEKYLHIKKEKVERAQRFLSGHGAWRLLVSACIGQRHQRGIGIDEGQSLHYIYQHHPGQVDTLHCPCRGRFISNMTYYANPYISFIPYGRSAIGFLQHEEC